MVAPYTFVLQILPKFLGNSNQNYMRKRDSGNMKLNLTKLTLNKPEKKSTSWSYEDNSYNIDWVVHLSAIDENSPMPDLIKIIKHLRFSPKDTIILKQMRE